MFESLEAIGAAWRAIAHITEWTGLSLGALAGLAALVYFNPTLLRVAIGAGVGVLIGWACLVHGHAVGVADEDAKLQTISDRGDAAASTKAKEDESALVAEIKRKADAQHAEDLATITELKASGASCAFDPGPDNGGVRPQTGAAAGAVSGRPKVAPVAKAPHKGAGAAALGRFLHLPVVWGAGVQGQGHPGDASPNRQ